jgi:hypothetical protein
MKLKDLISDDMLINEKSKMIETEIQKEINELGDLTKQIQKLKKQLIPLQKKYNDVMKEVIPVVEDLKKESLTTNKYIFQILKKGYQRQSFQYKEGFLESLDKVNENTKKILNQILEQTKKLTTIKPQIQIRPIEGIGDVFKKWINRFKMVIRKLSKNFKGIKDGNKQLRKLV